MTLQFSWEHTSSFRLHSHVSVTFLSVFGRFFLEQNCTFLQLCQAFSTKKGVKSCCLSRKQQNAWGKKKHAWEKLMLHFSGIFIEIYAKPLNCAWKSSLCTFFFLRDRHFATSDRTFRGEQGLLKTIGFFACVIKLRATSSKKTHVNGALTVVIQGMPRM